MYFITQRNGVLFSDWLTGCVLIMKYNTYGCEVVCGYPLGCGLAAGMKANLVKKLNHCSISTLLNGNYNNHSKHRLNLPAMLFYVFLNARRYLRHELQLGDKRDNGLRGMLLYRINELRGGNSTWHSTSASFINSI